MKNINIFLLEKLRITNDIKYSDNDYNWWWFGEMPDFENMPQDFYDHRKSNRKSRESYEPKNAPWYAVVIYLSLNPNSTWNDVRENLWAGKTGQQSELGTMLRQFNIMTKGREKSIQPFKEWTVPQYNFYKPW